MENPASRKKEHVCTLPMTVFYRHLNKYIPVVIWPGCFMITRLFLMMQVINIKNSQS